MNPERREQIEKLCLAALDRPEAQRASFLDGACTGDDALRHEVESLLRYQDCAKSFFEAPALEVAAKMAAADHAWSLIGQQIHHYRILSLLGVGGMGKVYLAEDTTLRRRVALKLLPAEFTQDLNRVQRFKQEARAISALNHPNIITIYEIGEAAGTHYIATEFIDGQTLRQRIIGGTMQIGEVVDVAVQVVGALSAAHQSGVIHRDIKPENVMVRKDGLVKVLDFGVAKLTESEAAGVDSGTETRDSVHTQTGAMMGTVRYMSPEQASGIALDSRSDIFSLGVVLHEMLAGKSPFEGASNNEIIAAILGHEPPPASSCRSDAPEALGRIVTRSLRKQVDERYQTAEQILDDLKELKQRLEIGPAYEKMPLAAKRSWNPRFSRKWGMGVAALILVWITIWRSLPSHNGTPPEVGSIMSLAILPLENLSGDPEQELFADGMTEELSANLGQIQNLRVPGRTSVMGYKGTKKSLSEIAAELRVDALVTGSVSGSGGKVRIAVSLIRAKEGGEEEKVWVGNYERDAQDVLILQNEMVRDIAREIKIQLSPREQQRLARTEKVDPKAHNLYMMGRQLNTKADLDGYSKAISYFREALEVAPTYAAPAAGLADTYLQLAFSGVLETAVALDVARQEAMRALELDPELAEAYVSLAIIELNNSNWAQAENHFNRALLLNPSYSYGYEIFAHFLAALGRFDAAIDAVQRARDLDPGSVTVNFQVGLIHYFSRQYGPAIEALQRTLDLNAEFQSAHELLGTVYEMVGMPDLAFAEYQRYLTTGGVPAVEVSAFERAYRSGGIRAYLQKLVDREKEEERLGYGVWPVRRAALYARLGDTESAMQWLETAFQERTPSLQDVRVAPVFDSLRKDPQFLKLVERLRFPPAPSAPETQRSER